MNANATEALAKIGALLPLLMKIPQLRHLPDGLRLNTDDLTKLGIFTIEHTNAPEGAGNRNVHISTVAATDPAHPIAICRSWTAPSGSVETISTTRVGRPDVKAEVAAAIDWLRTAWPHHLQCPARGHRLVSPGRGKHPKARHRQEADMNTRLRAQNLNTRINANTTSKTKLYPKALDRHLIAARKFAEREGGRNDDGTWTNPNYSLEQIWDNADSALIAIRHYREAVADPTPSRRRGTRRAAKQNATRIYLERLTTALDQYAGFPR